MTHPGSGGHSEDREALSRRRFMLRMAKAGASVVLAGGVSYFAYDPKGPDGKGQRASLAAIPSFSVPNQGGRMAIAQGTDRAKSLAAALAALGGIEQFIKQGDRVLLKVNAAFASPPMLSATTHPAIVREMAGLCLKAGAAEVRVTDNPINDPDSCFKLSGIAEAAEAAGAKLLLPKSQCFTPITLPNAALIRDWPVLTQPLQGITKVIGIAPLKDHHRSGASMTMKNWYGLLGGRRNVFHQDVHTIITELAAMIRPTLVILDATTAMMTNGPTGGSLSDLKQMNTMIVSTDQVAADAFGASLLGRSLGELPFIEKAANAGCGTQDWQQLKPGRI